MKSPNILTLQGLLHSTLRNHVLRLSSNMFQHVPIIKSSQEIADQIMLTCPALQVSRLPRLSSSSSPGIFGGLPFGKHTKKLWTNHHFFVGKLTINGHCPWLTLKLPYSIYIHRNSFYVPIKNGGSFHRFFYVDQAG